MSSNESMKIQFVRSWQANCAVWNYLICHNVQKSEKEARIERKEWKLWPRLCLLKQDSADDIMFFLEVSLRMKRGITSKYLEYIHLSQ